MEDIYGRELPNGFEMPERISLELIGVASVGGQIRRVYLSVLGPIDITDMVYKMRERPFLEKLSNWLRFGVYI
jgi:hypothetical protein